MSADGTALLEFNDFVTATKPKKISPTTQILNDTAKQYYAIGDMLKGRGNEEVVQNGQKIIDMVRLDTSNSFQFYKPNQNLQPRGVDVLSQLTCNWRFAATNFAYTQEQVSLNSASPETNWVRLLSSWRSAMQQDMWDGMETALWADADNAEMETETGNTAYSIPAFVTDDGLAPAGFTTVMGVNPTTKVNYRNQVEEYTAGSFTTTAFPAFDRMWQKLNWQQPGSSQEWFTSTEWRKFKIFTDLNGITQMTDLLRQSNDRLTTPTDAGGYNMPTYGGIPVKRVVELDAKAFANPKFFWIDARFMFPVFHSDRYMVEESPIRGGPNQPFSWAVFTNTYYNIFCRSRRRQGIVVAG
jgi:hypothetical protein